MAIGLLVVKAEEVLNSLIYLIYFCSSVNKSMLLWSLWGCRICFAYEWQFFLVPLPAAVCPDTGFTVHWWSNNHETISKRKVGNQNSDDLDCPARMFSFNPLLAHCEIACFVNCDLLLAAFLLHKYTWWFGRKIARAFSVSLHRLYETLGSVTNPEVNMSRNLSVVEMFCMKYSILLLETLTTTETFQGKLHCAMIRVTFLATLQQNCDKKISNETLIATFLLFYLRKRRF